MPKPLHEVLGEQQTRSELAVVAAFGVVATVWILLAGRDLLLEVPTWRGILAALLILDVAAGTAANLTRGTNRYYALRPRHRVAFIAVHVHLIAAAWLLEAPLAPAAAVWAYTVLAAVVVNRFNGSPSQALVGGAGLGAGLLIVTALAPSLGSPMAAVAALFLMKVSFAFAVDHYGDSRSP